MSHSQEPVVISGLGEAQPAHGTHDSSSLHVLQLDQRTYDRSLACVHCGLCLPACPTYTQTGLEADSPRGRIYLMKGMADGRIEATDAVKKHLDLCLDCRACETACPSGVVYHELIEETRARLAPAKPTLTDRFVQMLFYRVFPYPNRLKLALFPARVLQKLGLWSLLNRSMRRMLPAQLEKMQQMLPAEGALIEKPLATRYEPDADALIDGKPRAVVSLLSGCIGSVLFQEINRQTIRLLQKAGCVVRVPHQQACCGAIHHHGGQPEAAARFAHANIDALLPPQDEQVDYIVTNVAGCGAMLKDYSHLLRDDAQYAERAREFTGKVRDITQLLVQLAPPPPTGVIHETITYHDACHLAHAQKVTQEPRTLLGWISGLKLVPLTESDMCCGAAGTYNLSQPQMARDLADRKLKHIRQTGAKICVTANAGCAMQIQSEANRAGLELKVVHPVSLLYQAYFGQEKARPLPSADS